MKYLKYLVSYIASFFYDAYYFLFGNIRTRISGWNYYRASKLYPDYLKQGNMVEAVKFAAMFYCRGKGADIGAGRWPLPGARAIEDNPQENAYKINEIDNSLDYVFASHNLEHLKNWQNALKEWHRVLKPGGFLCLYLPHPVVTMWKPGVNKQHVWAPDSLVLKEFLQSDLKMDIEPTGALPDGYLSFLVVAKK